MLFYGKSAKDVTRADLQWLVDNMVKEHDRLDYKRDIYPANVTGKREMARDVIAMANHRGGHILIGIDENRDSSARDVIGIDAAGAATWIRNVCLTNVEPRILGFAVEEADVGGGRHVLLLDIPESWNAPHMVTTDDINQFWKRQGREKHVMSVEEVRDLFARSVGTQERMDRLFRARDEEIDLEARGSPAIAIQAIPGHFVDEALIDPLQDDVRKLVMNPPGQQRMHIMSGSPRATVNGLRADDSSPFGDDPPGKYLEIFRSGYVEFMAVLKRSGAEAPMLAGQVHPGYVVSFVSFVAALYGSTAATSSSVFRFCIHNATGLQLAAGGTPFRFPTWNRHRLDLGSFIVDDLSSEAQYLSKRVCDRLWNAFGYDESDCFNDAGVFRGI